MGDNTLPRERLRIKFSQGVPMLKALLWRHNDKNNVDNLFNLDLC